MWKTEEARKPFSRGTSALWSVSQQGLWSVRPSLSHTECSGAQTEELKAGPLRATSTFPSFSRNTWSVSYKPGIVVFSGGRRGRSSVGQGLYFQKYTQITVGNGKMWWELQERFTESAWDRELRGKWTSSWDNQKSLHGEGGSWVRYGRSGSWSGFYSEIGSKVRRWIAWALEKDAWVPTQAAPLINYVRPLNKFTYISEPQIFSSVNEGQ